jgi:hypothetical protein
VTWCAHTNRACSRWWGRIRTAARCRPGPAFTVSIVRLKPDSTYVADSLWCLSCLSCVSCFLLRVFPWSCVSCHLLRAFVSSWPISSSCLNQHQDRPRTDTPLRPSRSSRGGTASAHDARAIGRRVRKTQPEGWLLSGDGRSPRSNARRPVRRASGSGRGTAASSIREYGWSGRW